MRRPPLSDRDGLDEPQLRDSVPILASSLFHAVAQAQYAFVLPWMVVARGGSASGAVLSAATAYLPYLFVSPLAGVLGDRLAPRRLLCVTFGLVACAAAVYPVTALVTGTPPFALVYCSALAFGVGRPFVDAGSYRAIAAQTRTTVMQLQSARSMLTQAGGFGGPAIGLLIYHWRGATAVCFGVTALLVAAMLASAASVPRPRLRLDSARAALRSSFAYLRTSRHLKRLVLGIAAWNLAAGAAFSAVSPLLKEAGASADEASAVFLAGAGAVMLMTFPTVRFGLRRLSALSLFTAAVAVEGASFLVFSRSTGHWLFLLYACFVLANSVAASSSMGERALAIRPEEQALLSVVVQAAVSQAFFAGVLLAAATARLFALRDAALVTAALLVGVAALVVVARRRPLAVRHA